MAGYDTEIRVATKVDTSQMQRLQIQIDKAVDKVDALKKKSEELKTAKVPTEEYVRLSAQVKEAENLLARMVSKQKYLSDMGKEGTMQFKAMHEKIAAAESGLSSMRTEVQKLIDTGKDYKLAAGQEEINWTANELAAAESELRMLVTKHDELVAKIENTGDGLKKVGSAGKKTFSEMNGHVKKSGSLFGTFLKKIKSIVLGLLIFNQITKGFNAMVSGIKEGFKNLVQYSDEYNRSISSLQSANAQLKNSFAAAFAPIVQMVIPYLVKLISYVTSAINVVAQLIALLAGKSTWTRATAVQKNYAKSLSGTASAAKKAAGALAAFDELDVLNKNNSDSGGGAGGIDPGSMFEEVPIDSKVKDWLDGILEKLKPIADYLKKLGSIFMDGFWEGLGDYQYRLDIIKNGLETIKDVLIDIWTDPEVVEAAQGYVESLVHMFGTLAGAITSIALTLAAFFIGGLAGYLEQNEDRIKEHIISMFNVGTEINQLLEGYFKSAAYIFEAFASEDGIRFSTALIGSIVDTFMGLSEVLLKLGRDILEIIITPITDNADEFKVALEGLLAAGANVLEGFKASIDNIFDNINKVYDEHFKPFFDSVANGVSQLTNVFLTMWNEHISPILQELGTKVGELHSQYIAPFVNAVVELVGNLVTKLQGFWEDIIMPMIEVLITYVFPVVADLFDVCITGIINGVELLISGFTEFVEFINYLLEQWQETWNSAKEVFSSYWDHVKSLANLLKDLLTNIFATVKALVNGDWKLAWDNAKNIFTGFKKNVKGVIDSLKAFLQNFFDWIGSMVESAIEKIKSIGESIGNFFSGGSGGEGGGGASFQSYASYQAMEVPHLASGAVIRGGDPFMAILGDQRAGQTNVEAPLSTIEDAVRNVMDENTYSGGGDMTINLNYDGETFARLFLPDFFSEMHRQGYDLEFEPE